METASTATAVLRAVHGLDGHEFWSDSLSYVDASLEQVRGHRQVTDAYLASLVAARPGSVLATLDHGLAQERPDVTVLLPS